MEGNELKRMKEAGVYVIDIDEPIVEKKPMHIESSDVDVVMSNPECEFRFNSPNVTCDVYKYETFGFCLPGSNVAAESQRRYVVKNLKIELGDESLVQISRFWTEETMPAWETIKSHNGKRGDELRWKVDFDCFVYFKGMTAIVRWSWYSLEGNVLTFPCPVETDFAIG